MENIVPADQQDKPQPIEDDRVDKGFVKIWRSIRYDPIYKDSNAFHLFTHCLLRASDRAKVVIHYGQKVSLERGQFVTGRKKLHEETGISENIIRHRLKLLENIGKITIKSTNKFSIITICNYGYSQGFREGKQPTDTPTNHQQTTTKKKIKEYYYGEDSIEFQIAHFLLQEIRKNKPDFKEPNLRSWAKEIHLMIHRDNRKPDRINQVISWCQRNSFWSKNILSTGNLRKNFDRLEMEMESESEKAMTKVTRQVEYRDLTEGKKL